MAAGFDIIVGGEIIIIYSKHSNLLSNSMLNFCEYDDCVCSF